MAGQLRKIQPSQLVRLVEVFPRGTIPQLNQVVFYGKYDKYGNRGLQPFAPQNFVDIWRQFKDMPATRQSPLFNFMNQWEKEFDSFMQPENIEKTSKGVSGKAIRLDVNEDKEKYTLQADLPGLQKSDIKINLNSDNILTISGQRNMESKQENGQRHMIERYYGTFERAIKFSKPVDKNNIKAKVENGVLQLTIPKQQIEQESEIYQINVD